MNKEPIIYAIEYTRIVGDREFTDLIATVTNWEEACHAVDTLAQLYLTKRAGDKGPPLKFHDSHVSRNLFSMKCGGGDPIFSARLLHPVQVIPLEDIVAWMNEFCE